MRSAVNSPLNNPARFLCQKVLVHYHNIPWSGFRSITWHGPRGQVRMIGQRLGTFLIDNELGSGSMGTVYRGIRDTGKTRVAAVKVINPERMARGTTFERFIREIEILQKLHHSNIVRYLAHGKSGKTYYYAMEYVRGQTLEMHLADHGHFFWVDVVRYAIQICDALQYSHDHHVIHRDLKPSNLMVTQDVTIKLTDFGIAKDLDATGLTASFLTLGTARYMSPEQFRGAANVGHKTDLYALGVVMYEMLTGELPFQGDTVLALMNSHMNDPRPKPSDKTCIIPVQLDKLVPKLMAKAKENRPLDAAAVATALRGLLAKLEANEEIPMFRPDVGPSKKREDDPRPNKGPRKDERPTFYDRFTEALPTLGLFFCLVAIGALIVYVLWWPSAEYLHDKAKWLMASEERSDWLLVPKYYLDDLDRWYPNHQYKSETEDWRDRIALSSARHRADVLDGSPARSPWARARSSSWPFSAGPRRRSRSVPTPMPPDSGAKWPPGSRRMGQSRSAAGYSSRSRMPRRSRQ